MRKLVVACVVLLALAGCSRSVDGVAERSPVAAANSSAAPQQPMPPAPPGLERFYNQQLTWTSCDTIAPSEGPYPAGTRCAMLTVPVDYSKPDGTTAQIAVYQARASGDKIGSLLTNPGGPGVSGIEYASGATKDMSRTEVGEHFDFIGFDPRGIGASTPAVRCLSDADMDAQRADPQVDYSPAGIDRIEQQSKDFAAKCTAAVGNEFLAHVGTVDVVQDMDVLRAALGDSGLNYLGYSYGTRIGTAYAEKFPTHVRAMILDGAVDPTQDQGDSEVAQAAGFQKAFDDFAADCAKDSSCPLGTDPTRAVARFQQLVKPLITTPAPTRDPRGLGYSDAITGTIQALYSPQLWTPLTKGLSDLARTDSHRGGDVLLSLADSYSGRDAQGHYDNSSDAFTAIRCVDNPQEHDRARAAQIDAAHRSAAPFLDPGGATGTAPLDTCAFWPVPSSSTPHTPSVSGLGHVVVVSTTHDPATPYQAGVDLAKQLNGTLITFDGTQHTASFEGNACIDDALTNYLVDPTEPVPDKSCS